MTDPVNHKGGCHCGAVKFEVRAGARIEVVDCNCSVCRMTGFKHLIVPKEDFTLLTSEEALTDYQFGTKTAHHLFCKTCGIKSYYLPRSHPDGVSVNVNCLEPVTIKAMELTPFDGANWEDAIDDLTD